MENKLDLIEKRDEILEKNMNLIDYLKSTSPLNVLKDSGYYPSAEELRSIESIMFNHLMDIGTLNVLLQYMLIKEKTPLPLRYMEKIHKDWKERGINTAEDAFVYLKQIHISNKNKKIRDRENRTNNETSIRTEISIENQGKENSSIDILNVAMLEITQIDELVESIKKHGLVDESSNVRYDFKKGYYTITNKGEYNLNFKIILGEGNKG